MQTSVDIITGKDFKDVEHHMHSTFRSKHFNREAALRTRNPAAGLLTSRRFVDNFMGGCSSVNLEISGDRVGQVPIFRFSSDVSCELPEVLPRDLNEAVSIAMGEGYFGFEEPTEDTFLNKGIPIQAYGLYVVRNSFIKELKSYHNA
jgi:hypothetical protein